MLPQAYPSVPTLAQWKNDSFVGTILGPRRAEDPALLTIDELVGSLAQAGSPAEEIYLLAELFFATMWWINNHKANARMQPGRRPAILRLNLCAANKLAAAFGCGIGELGPCLREAYGISMTDHGVECDGPGGVEGRYMNLARRERYRVVFRHGLAHRFPSAGVLGAKTELTLLDTGDEVDTSQRTGLMFVMSMSGELYVGKAPFVSYHSSFMAGKPVMCAGTIVVDNGRITRLANDSGHYAPTDFAMVKVLSRLRTAGVNLAAIQVVGAKSGAQARGDSFLAANGNWDSATSKNALNIVPRK